MTNEPTPPARRPYPKVLGCYLPLALVVMLVLILSNADKFQSGTPTSVPGMTLTQYGLLREGMTVGTVGEILDGEGMCAKSATGSADLGLTRWHCAGDLAGSSADLVFQYGKLATKTQENLR